jgi:uncharacterized protein YcfL
MKKLLILFICGFSITACTSSGKKELTEDQKKLVRMKKKAIELECSLYKPANDKAIAEGREKDIIVPIGCPNPVTGQIRRS